MLVLFVTSSVYAQIPGYTMEIESDTIPGLPGIHSYAWAKHNGLWLIIGGRTNGLHGFQPPFAFPLANQNTTLYVVDPVNEQTWSAGTTALSVALREHISSSNMEFIQDSTRLYFFGGYGYRTADGDHATFPNLTAIDVPGLITAIQTAQPVAGYFRQITDQRFAVTGGHAGRIGSRYFIAFGHRFDGRYNPNNGPSFTQTYTEAIRWFDLNDDGTTITINNYVSEVNPNYYHRRDYNLSPQIFPGGVFGYTGFTGVFRADVDLPYFNSVNITAAGGVADSSYQQLLNQYHTANFAAYDSASQVTHTVFLGGMGMYYYNLSNVLTQDSLVPFVSTISVISRGPSATTESVMPIHMPGYQGSSAEYIPVDNQVMLYNEILSLDQLDSGRILIGYMFGGIESSLPNIFMQASGTSWASNQVTRVYLRRDTATEVAFQQEQVADVNVFPNPADDSFMVSYQLQQPGYLNISMYDASGRQVRTNDLGNQPAGTGTLRISTERMKNGMYFVVINVNGTQHVSKVSVAH